MTKFINTDRQHNDDEIKAIASTGGLVGIRYMGNKTSYKLLAEEIDYIAKLVGIEHAVVSWLGHDIGHPYTGEVPGVTKNAKIPVGVEAQSMYEHWNNFIKTLQDLGYSDEQIALVLWGNYVRVWNDILME